MGLALMPFGNRQGVSQEVRRHHPGGMIENSPAFQRRDSVVSGISPEGTAEWKHLLFEFNRPFGTWHWVPLNPALKRWAILRMSLRDKTFGAAHAFTNGIRAGVGILTCEPVTL